MKINKIEFKNFASYGNQLQVIEFDDKGYLFLTVGANGYGKTTISNVIKFLLYGKVDGANMADLPNRINKNLWGRIEIVCKKKLIVIERGIAPNVFDITINGKEYEQAGKLNMQEYLEKEFFEIPYHVFRNIIILSVNDFKSFLTMNPGDKKAIVDKLFGFSVINDMKEIVKLDRKFLREEIKTFEDELNIISESIFSINAKLNELEKNSKVINKEKIKELKGTLKILSEDKEKLIIARRVVNETIEMIEKDIEKHVKLFGEKKSTLEKAKDKVNLYKKKKCPECGTDLQTGEHLSVKHESEKTVKDLPAEMNELKSDVETLKGSITENKGKLHKIISRVSSLETNMKNFKGELLEIAGASNQGEEFGQLKTLIMENRAKEGEKSRDKISKGDEDYYLQILEQLLGEDGVKNLAMTTILPALNNNISLMIKQIHLPFTMRFDKKFDCNITSLGEEINPKTMSTGERKKADFVIIIALIKLLKLRYPTLNILFLDEIFSSVDSEGIYNIIDILHKTIQEINLNTFVINHSVLPSELFDKKVEIVKDQGFSSLEISDLE